MKAIAALLLLLCVQSFAQDEQNLRRTQAVAISSNTANAIGVGNTATINSLTSAVSNGGFPVGGGFPIVGGGFPIVGGGFPVVGGGFPIVRNPVFTNPTVTIVRQQPVVKQPVVTTVKQPVQVVQSVPVKTVQSVPVKTVQSVPVQVVQSVPVKTVQSIPVQTVQKVQATPVKSTPIVTFPRPVSLFPFFRPF
eukprot:GILJ01016226.1.p1 GENE.GILJ01016226.1~~GILJ01016226.1.p1  ORF type:complete len:193 (-),score=28.21 GILJ01016226.1:33-611(-)